MKKTPYQKCYNLALYYLAKRQHSTFELSTKLHDKEHSPEDIAKVTEKLTNLNFLNDYEFAFSRIRYRYETSRWGLTRIKLELKQKRVNSDIIEKAIAERYADDTLQDEKIVEQAFDLIYSRYKNKVILENNRLSTKDYSKIVGFLGRRGYSNGQIKQATTLFLENL
jgi:regulatory protein